VADRRSTPEVAVTQPLSLLDFLRGLQTDAAFRSEFSANPESTIADHGLSDLSPYDVHDALVLMEDNETADFSHDYGAGASHHLPPPPPVHTGDEQQAAVQYLSDYVATAFTGQTGPSADAFDQDADLDLLSASHASPGVDGGGHVIGDADAGFGEGDSTSGFIGSVHISSTSLDASDQPLGHVDEAFGGSLLDGFDYGYSGDSEQSAAGVDRFAEADHTGGEEHAHDPSHPPTD
jgi:hypothetical protein